MPSWKGKTRGGLLGHKIFVFILKRLGLAPAYFVLRFVAAYFVLFAPSSTKSIYKYFRKIQHYGPFKAFISVYESYYVFGQTLLDKIAIASGMLHKFNYTSDGVEHLEKLNLSGGIVISAHLGNWDIAGLLLNKTKFKTHVLMFEAEHQKIKDYLELLMKDRNTNVIPISQDLSHIFKVNEVLQKKEVICMHGDRFVEGSRILEKLFMGKMATFPLGPFSIVSKLNVPYSIAFAVRGKNRTYHLSATPIYPGQQSPEDVLDQYTLHLEAKLAKYPNQWFNFYDFWSEEVKGATVN